MKPSHAAVALATSALLTLTACGSSDSLEPASDDRSSAPVETTEPTEEPTAEPTEEPTTEPTEGPPEAPGGDLSEAEFLTTVTEAQMAAQTTQMDVSMDLEGQSITMTAAVQGAETLEDSAMQADMEIPGTGSIELILVDENLYMGLGELTDGKFIQLSLDDPSTDQFLGQLKSQLNPAETTRALQGAVTNFQVSGAETVDGHETTKYVLEVDAKEVLESLGGAADLPGVELPKTMTYTFWVDAEELPVRANIDMGQLGFIDIHFSGWGEPVDIQAPPRRLITKDNPFAPAA